MAHRVGRFELKYEHRGSWKAERWSKGRLVDIIPVTWASGWNSQGPRLVVWFQHIEERDRHLASDEPFVIALAKEKDSKALPPEFASFQGVFKVESLGQPVGDYGVECKVIERLDS